MLFPGLDSKGLLLLHGHLEHGCEVGVGTAGDAGASC